MSPRIATLLAVVGLAVAGCGADQSRDSADPSPSSSASASASPSSLSPSPPPSSAPPSNPQLPTPSASSRPPKKPTDTIAGKGWVTGTATADSTGPCYGLVTDDGQQYALHSADGFAVKKGARIRVRVARLAIKIYCGPGEHASVTEYQPVR